MGEEVRGMKAEVLDRAWAKRSGDERTQDLRAKKKTFAYKHTHMMHITRLRLANPLRGVEVTESSTYASSY
jgi:hypothetical protein